MPETSKERIEFLRRLRSTKAFTSEPLSDDVINDILEVGRWSGSGSNRDDRFQKMRGGRRQAHGHLVDDLAVEDCLHLVD